MPELLLAGLTGILVGSNGITVILHHTAPLKGSPPAGTWLHPTPVI